MQNYNANIAHYPYIMVLLIKISHTKETFMKITIKQIYLVLLCITNLLHGSATFKLGLENIDEYKTKFTQIKYSSIRFALITNHTGKDQQGNRTLDVLLKHGIDIPCILAPEHGFQGNVPAGQTVHADRDQKTGIPIVSLYKHGTGKSVDKQIYETIDAFIFDMQEAGMRHYTYLSTLVNTMHVAADQDKLFIVLDRPNILGNRIEGPLLSSDVKNKKSFIAALDIPLRHGMTIGELAIYCNTHVLKKPVRLEVIAMEGYTRQTALPSTLVYNLSPNIINRQSCYGYSFLGLLGEIQPFDVGIGTTRPFTTIALPNTMLSGAQWKQLQKKLQALNIMTTVCNYISPRNNTAYQGLHLHITAIEQLHAFEALLTLLHFVKKNGVNCIFSPHFDQAVGTDLVRRSLEENISFTELTDSINKALKKFWIQAQSSFIYKPWPLITSIPKARSC